KWFTQAAKQGDADAQCNLGYCYDNGQGVEQSYEKAVKWWTKAAEQGDAGAQYNLGVCYEKGNGVEQSREKAIFWNDKAAKQGYSDAISAAKNLFPPLKRTVAGLSFQQEYSAEQIMDAISKYADRRLSMQSHSNRFGNTYSFNSGTITFGGELWDSATVKTSPDSSLYLVGFHKNGNIQELQKTFENIKLKLKSKYRPFTVTDENGTMAEWKDNSTILSLELNKQFPSEHALSMIYRDISLHKRVESYADDDL
ncbi:MAG: sel1 repeat family protein, partial [Bacteroidales bacterium]|nr:sel1 repeat family protein [Candidatus Colimorpha onthohippi]